jgi:integrase
VTLIPSLSAIENGSRPTWLSPAPDGLHVSATRVRTEIAPLTGRQLIAAPATARLAEIWLARGRAERRAGLEKLGVHMLLRHTFCSHLAMRGAPARAIQELAGHQDLTTTQRYMHLSPAAIENAIRLLDQPAPGTARGDSVETGGCVKS